MAEKNTAPDSLRGTNREYLREQDRTNELLADIAGVEYVSPGDPPKTGYMIEKRLLDAAQKKNELLDEIATGGGGGSASTLGLSIDYATDVISLKKSGEPISGSGATLPAYGVSFDPTTGGLTLTKNGTAVQGQTVTIPNYGSPVGVTDSSAMTDHDTIYLYEGTTGGGYTNGHFYYWDGTAWADGGEYAAATVQTDKTLLVEDRAADAKATGEAIGDLKTQLGSVENNSPTRYYPTFIHGKIDKGTGVEDTTVTTQLITQEYIKKSDVTLFEFGDHTGATYIYNYNLVNNAYEYVGRNQRSNPTAGDFTSWLHGLSGDYFRINVQKATDDTATWLTVAMSSVLKKTVDTLTSEIGRLDNENESIKNLIGYFSNSFSVTAGVNHLSSKDKLSVDIKQGETYHVVIIGNFTKAQIYEVYADSTYANVSTGKEYEGTASKNIVEIGIYINGDNIPVDGTVTTEAYLIDSLYGKSTLVPDKKIITTTVLGSDLPNDISQYGVSSAYASKMKEAIDAWMGDYAGDSKKVPIIVHTDQHGRLTISRKGIFDLIDYLVNWDGVSAIFDLGDTVVDRWEDDDTNSNPLLRNETLEIARQCLYSIPKNKQINVYGNHDTWYSGDVPTTVTGVLPSLQYNNPYFTSDGLITKMLDDNSGFKIIYDTKNNIKYFVLAGWDYADKPYGTINNNYYWINKPHIEWIIDEFAKNDGYDLVLISHVPLEMGAAGSIDPITSESIVRQNPIYITHDTSFLVPLWNARKTKTSGSISYNSESVPFDFTSCENDCLCALSGHTHFDGVEYLNGTGLLQVSFDWFTNNTIHFVIIDRRNEKVKCWKLNEDDDTPAVDVWEMPFDKA